MPPVPAEETAPAEEAAPLEDAAPGPEEESIGLLSAPLETGSIKGTVTDAGGSPAAGVTIDAARINPQDGEWDFHVHGIKTAANGSYTVTGLPDGTYTLYFYPSNAGHANGSRTGVVVSGGGETAGADFSLKTGVTIKGTVKSFAGKAAAKVEVFALKKNSAGVWDTVEIGNSYAITDSKGRYTLSHLETGTYTLQFCYQASKEYEVQYFGRTYESKKAKSFSISGGTKTADYLLKDSKKLEVTFNSKGGLAVAGKSLKSGAKIGTLPKAKRAGYTFNGWYTKASGGIKITKTEKIKKNITYYAQWTANSYKVTFNVNGGEPIPAKTKILKFGDAYGKLAKPVQEGYTFKGWYTKKTGGVRITAQSKVETAKNHTLYARWKDIEE
ncbi:MAG: InlB B-repeat-containing protein [Clostridiales Family XIII bacterium]|nr:InlB B-repeat-containing protein [Clostridiales Family XIII bacterium]